MSEDLKNDNPDIPANSIVPYLFGSFEETIDWRRTFIPGSDWGGGEVGLPVNRPEVADMIIICRSFLKKDELELRRFLSIAKDNVFLVAIGTEVVSGGVLKNHPERLDLADIIEFDYVFPANRATPVELKTSYSDLLRAWVGKSEVLQ